MFAERTHAVIVNYDLSLEEMIAAGRYGEKDGDINEQNIPIQGSGTCETEIALFHFDRKISTSAVLEELSRSGFRAATLPELLALGADQPELQRQFSIIALGSIMRGRDRCRYVVVLTRYGVERRLCLGSYSLGWSDVARFAAVHKVAQ